MNNPEKEMFFISKISNFYISANKYINQQHTFYNILCSIEKQSSFIMGTDVKHYEEFICIRVKDWSHLEQYNKCIKRLQYAMTKVIKRVFISK